MVSITNGVGKWADVTDQNLATWVVDLIVSPVLLVGGFWLGRGKGLGYAWGAGLLLTIGLLCVGVPISFALGAAITGTAFDAGTLMLLIIGSIPLALLTYYIRGPKSHGSSPSIDGAR